jgi:RNA polymerase sigma-70 factor, ECF subfamily
MALTTLQIDVAHRAGREAWPALALSRDRFDNLCREAGIVEDALRARPEDVFLAFAAREGDPTAIKAIDDKFVARLESKIRRFGTPPHAIPDALQAIRERLFAGPVPRIRSYNASIPLERWIRIVGVRAAIDLGRTERALLRSESASRRLVISETTDAAALLARVEYKARFESALRQELSSLPPRDKTVLRLHLIEGISIEKVAQRYGVNRVTVARWVWNASEVILAGLRRRFKEDHGIVPQDFDSLVTVMRSQLSIDLGDLLKD